MSYRPVALPSRSAVPESSWSRHDRSGAHSTSSVPVLAACHPVVFTHQGSQVHLELCSPSSITAARSGPRAGLISWMRSSPVGPLLTQDRGLARARHAPR